MSIWQTLGLEPTGDLDAIKQAYAERAKQYHPEEHPDEFRALHDAYRQATRYARQHPSSAAQPKPVPSAQPRTAAFKPSFHVPRASDNPRRAHLYRSSDDEFDAEQLRAVRKESKSASRPAPPPRFQPPKDATLPRGKLPIRGAGRSGEPSGGLKFDAVEQSDDGDGDPAAKPVVTLQAPPDVPSPASLPRAASTGKPAHPYRMATLLLILWGLYLFTLFFFVPVLVSLLLYAVWLIQLVRKGTIQRSWPLTIFAACLDFLSMTAFYIAFVSVLPLSMQEPSAIVFTFAAFGLILYRLVLRLCVLRQSHK